jgi:DNA-binding IclR family transcriptional regulator
MDTIHAHKFTLLSLLWEKGPQSPKQLIEMSRFPTSTTYRFLTELRAFGLTEQDSSKNWQLSEEWKATWNEILPSVKSY